MSLPPIPSVAPRKPSLALGLSGPSQLQTLPCSRSPSPSWIVSEPSTQSVARVVSCVQAAFSELTPLDDQDSTAITEQQALLTSTAFSDQREAAITGAYVLAKRGKWQQLLPAAPDLNVLTNACGLTVLMVAVSEGDETAARGLVENGISAFSKNAQGTSALHLAARRGSSQMMEIVQDTAGNVDKTDAFMRTPLHEAVFHNNTEAVRFLVEDLGAKLDSPAPYAPGLWDEEPLITEAEDEATPAQATSGKISLMASPITLAVLMGRAECFDIMMQRRDARTDITSTHLGNLCHIAVHFGQTHMLEHLLQNHLELAQGLLKGEDAEGLTPACVAAATGDIDSLDVIRRYARKTLLAKDRNGRTPVHWAAKGAHKRVLEFYGGHIPTDISCFTEPDTPIGGLDSKSPLNLLQDLKRQHPHNSRVLGAAAATQRLMRQRKQGRLEPMNLRRTPPKNAVFRGGGPSGIAFVGGIEVLERTDQSGNEYESLAALRTANQPNILDSIERIAGASAGAIAGGLVCLGYNATEIKGILDSFNLMDLLDTTTQSAQAEQLSGEEFLSILGKRSVVECTEDLAESLIGLARYTGSAAFRRTGKITKHGIIGCFEKLFKQNAASKARFAKAKGTFGADVAQALSALPPGICSGDRFLQEVRGWVAAKTGDPDCTFKEFRARVQRDPKQFKHLHVYATRFCHYTTQDGEPRQEIKICRLTSEEIELPPGETAWWENVTLASAIRASMSIPLVFEPHVLLAKENGGVRSQGSFGVFMDGGLLKNFPIDAFDERQYQAFSSLGEESFRIFTNKRTLGFNLTGASGEEPVGQSDAAGVIRSVLQTYSKAEEKILEQMTYNRNRVINIDRSITVPGVDGAEDTRRPSTAVDFDLSAAQKQELIEAGRESVRSFFLTSCRGGDRAEAARPELSSQAAPAESHSPPQAPTKREPTHAELQAQKAFAVPSKKKVDVQRIELLEKVEASFAKQSTVVVHGITGAGKTRLAESYARKQAAMKQVYWINVGVEDLLVAYTRLALKLTLITEEDLKSPRGAEVAIAAVKRYFTEHPDSLLVLDDVTTEDDLEYTTPSGKISFLPEGAQVLVTHVLITSQSDIFSDVQAEFVELEKLKPEECVELLQKTIEQEPPQELLEELAERLFYHPLLVDMTGCYIRQVRRREKRPAQGIIIEEIDKLKESLTHLPKGRKEAIHQEVEKRWMLNLARAKEENEYVEETLGICAYLAPTRIPLDWFEGELRRSFGFLEAFGFCHRDSEEGYISMHGLVQRLSRRKDNEHLALQTAADIVEKKWGYAEEEFNIAEEVKQNVAHVEQALEHLIKAEVHTEQVAVLLMVLGRFQRVGAFFKASQRACEDGLKILRAIHGQKAPHPDMAKVLMNLGEVAFGQGELGLAKERLEQALRMMQTLYGQGAPHPNVALVLMNLGNVASEQGELELPKERLEQALEMMQTLYGQKAPHPNVARVLINLGVVAFGQGELELAKERYEQALEMMQALYGQGASHPNVAKVLMNLGVVALGQGELELPKERYEQALRMMQALYGQKTPHPDVALVLMNLGAVALGQGELELAKERSEQALEMMQTLYGQKAPHPRVAQVLSNLGEVARQQGELELAKERSEQALEMMQALYGQGASHPNVARVLMNLGEVALGQEELGLAKEHSEQGFEMMQALYGQGTPHPNVALALVNLGEVARQQGELELAKEHFEQALRMMQAVYGEGAQHPHLVKVLLSLGLVNKELGNLAHARDFFSKDLAMARTIYRTDAHPLIQEALKGLANLGAASPQSSLQAKLEHILDQSENLESKSQQDLRAFVLELEELWNQFEGEYYDELFAGIYTRAQDLLE